MRLNKFRIILIFSLLFTLGFVNGQIIINPVVHSKSHPSLTIDSIILSWENSRFFLSVKNLSTEGDAWFCADADITVTVAGSNKIHALLESRGIPVCPDRYKFKETGEILHFELIFPPLKAGTRELDLTENCADNCFSLMGISLDNRLNAEIRLFEKAVRLYGEERLNEALLAFEKIEKESVYHKENHFAYTLYILPLIYHELEQFDKAKLAYFSLKKSKIQEKQYFLKKLAENPFFDALGMYEENEK